jgi:hypothetical protein
MVDNPTHRYDLSRNPKEGQGPHSAVEPMMMMMELFSNAPELVILILYSL